jgi:flagellar biosynthesis/type III secretory pathway protein FliH
MNKYLKYAIIAGIILIILGVAYYQRNTAYAAYQKYIESAAASKIAEIKKEKDDAQKQYEIDRKAADAQLKTLTDQISINKAVIQSSQSMIKQLQTERDNYKEQLRIRLSQIVVPIEQKDIKERLMRLGYATCN